ncbi:MAG: T9SS type A sorting domain-containing protein [Bacteroidetes bacterium]|nr:T9SS type A sorting domain-containing protein [Bacteroidota bacterium]
MKQLFWILCTLTFALHSQAQEKESPLTKIQPVGEHAKGLKTLLEIPFFDDFSAGRAAVNVPDAGRWVNAGVYTSAQMPIAPLTLGAAIFDGLNSEGMPYDFSNPFAQGAADTLTSMPLNLAGLDSTDQVYLFFYLQAAGHGNMPDDVDSMYVDFFSPITGQWDQVLSIASDNTTDWIRHDLHIKQAQFLQSGFAFRFRNDATLSGAYDQWNLDYVNVQEGVDTANYQFNEVAMQYTPSNILSNGYTAMPWKHFVVNPEVHLADSLKAFEQNLGPTENIVTGYSITVDGSQSVFNTQNLNTFNNDFRAITTTMLWNNTSILNANAQDSVVNVEVCTFINQADPHLENDTACYTLHLANYYAYDDGGAERSWTVQGAGASVAMKFYNHEADTLMGIAVNWIPYGSDESNQNFFLRVWNDDGGQPGDVISENFNYQSPAYDTDGYTQFHYHALDQPLALPAGTFYVGWVQSDPGTYDVGNDKNTNNNPAKLFYVLGSDQQWIQSETTGSLLLRPYLKAGENQVWEGVNHATFAQSILYPNPANDVLFLTNVGQGQLQWKMWSSVGTCINQGVSNSSALQWDVQDLPAGLYFLTIESPAGVETLRWIKQ